MAFSFIWTDSITSAFRGTIYWIFYVVTVTRSRPNATQTSFNTTKQANEHSSVVSMTHKSAFHHFTRHKFTLKWQLTRWIIATKETLKLKWQPLILTETKVIVLLRTCKLSDAERMIANRSALIETKHWILLINGKKKNSRKSEIELIFRNICKWKTNYDIIGVGGGGTSLRSSCAKLKTNCTSKRKEKKHAFLCKR